MLSWQNLPKPVLARLGEFLTSDEISNSSYVCKKWNQIFNSEFVWKKKFENSYFDLDLSFIDEDRSFLESVPTDSEYITQKISYYYDLEKDDSYRELSKCWWKEKYMIMKLLMSLAFKNMLKMLELTENSMKRIEKYIDEIDMYYTKRYIFVDQAGDSDMFIKFHYFNEIIVPMHWIRDDNSVIFTLIDNISKIRLRLANSDFDELKILEYIYEKKSPHIDISKIKSITGETPLTKLLSVWNPNSDSAVEKIIECIKLLFKFNADPNEKNKKLHTPLYTCLLNSKNGRLFRLLNKETFDENNNKHAKTIIKLLLEAGAHPNIPCGDDSDHPITLASKLGYFNIAELLLEGGADPLIKNKNSENMNNHFLKTVNEKVEYYENDIKLFTMCMALLMAFILIYFFIYIY